MNKTIVLNEILDISIVIHIKAEIVAWSLLHIYVWVRNASYMSSYPTCLLI